MRAEGKRESDGTVPGGPAVRCALVLDFDGTITKDDLLDEMARRFGDPAVYREVEEALHAGTITLRECITREYEPVTLPLDEAVEWVLENVGVRAGLRELVELAHRRGWRVRVLSSGFEEFIEPVLRRAGVDGVEIVANALDARPDGWRVIWRHEAECGHCREQCKRSGLPAADEIVYVGDGISDRCAALAADRVFATRGLARYLDENGTPYEAFGDFHDIARALAPV
jgi:2-hydroxy-3-keto-5-methylthiopentenyl-1-phosphate phosphatase